MTRAAFVSILATLVALHASLAHAGMWDKYEKVKNMAEDLKDKVSSGMRMGNVEPKHKAADREELMSAAYTEEILADLDIEETPSPDEDSPHHQDGQLTENEVNKIWAEHMQDFVPEDMVHVIIEANEVEALFEWIGHETPTQIKGAYYVIGGNADKVIDCVIYDAQ